MASVVLGLYPSRHVSAHPLGNFAICHYTRLQAEKDEIRILYILDLAEIPTVEEKRQMDGDRDGTVRSSEKQDYLAAQSPRLLDGLTLHVNDRAVPLRKVGGELTLSPGAGGLETLKIRLDLRGPASFRDALSGGLSRSQLRECMGWKEIIAVGGTGMALRESSVSATDRSRELTAYPIDVIPPQNTELAASPRHSIWLRGAVGRPRPRPTPGRGLPSTSQDDSASDFVTPRDTFTQLIAVEFRERASSRLV